MPKNQTPVYFGSKGPLFSSFHDGEVKLYDGVVLYSWSVEKEGRVNPVLLWPLVVSQA